MDIKNVFSINGNFPQLCKIKFNGINEFWDDSIDSLTENYDDAYGRKTWTFWKGTQKIGLHRGPQENMQRGVGRSGTWSGENT